MPMSEGASNKAREENIKREIAAGKDPKQAVAIGYAKQRENRKASDSALSDSLKYLADCLKKIVEVCERR